MKATFKKHGLRLIETQGRLLQQMQALQLAINQKNEEAISLLLDEQNPLSQQVIDGLKWQQTIFNQDPLIEQDEDCLSVLNQIKELQSQTADLALELSQHFAQRAKTLKVLIEENKKPVANRPKASYNRTEAQIIDIKG